MKAAPPLWPAMNGKRQTLPSPTAEPAVAKMIPILLAKFARLVCAIPITQKTHAAKDAP
jgi:hypothetical protein